MSEQQITKKVYLQVPFDDKDYVKLNGGKWDSEIKRWYVMMTPEEIKTDNHKLDRFRLVYFDCPIRLKDKVKELGGIFLKSESKPFTNRGNYELLKLLRKSPKEYESIIQQNATDDIFV